MPSIQVISAIGIYIGIYLLAVVVFSLRGNKYRADSAIAIIITLLFVTSNYEYLAVASITFFWLYSQTYRKSKNTSGRVSLNSLIDDIVLDDSRSSLFTWSYILFTIFTFLFSIPTLIVFQFTIALMDEVAFFMKEKVLLLYQVFLVFIVVPVCISYYTLANTSVSLVGISYHEAEVISTNSDTIRGIIVHQDNSFLYIKDQLFSDNTLNYSLKSIAKITTLKPKKNYSHNGLYYFVYNYFYPGSYEPGVYSYQLRKTKQVKLDNIDTVLMRIDTSEGH